MCFDRSFKKRFRPAAELKKKTLDHFIEILHANGHFDYLNGVYTFLDFFDESFFGQNEF